MSREAIETDDDPPAIGTCSEGVVDGDRTVISGQDPVDLDNGEVVREDLSGQTARTLENVADLLEVTANR